MSNSQDTSKYGQSGVSSRGAEASLDALLKHIVPSRNFNPAHPPKIESAYFANVIDFGDGMGVAFCTDGVGTKIVVAELLDRYDTIGIDCAAMNVNDVICVGARPVSLVDYIACSFTDERVFGELGQGLAEGARQAGVNIPGGEISQVKELITGIDLVGACIGKVDINKINTGAKVAPGDIIVGLAASGVHSNGLTLARRVLLGESREEQSANVRKHSDALGRSLGEELLEPTRIYVQPIMEILDAGIDVRAMVHITSGGYCNLNRVQADNIRFVIDNPPLTPAVFSLIQETGEVSDREMHEVFNMGVGFCVIVRDEHLAEGVIKIAEKHGTPAQVIGHVEACQGKEVVVPQKNLRGTGQSFQ